VKEGNIKDYWVLFFSVSTVGGPFLGGVFTQKVSWRWAFYVNIPIAAITLPLIYFKLKLTRASPIKHKIDFAGIITLVTSMVCLLLGLTWGGITYPWNSSIVLGLIVASVVFAISFFIIEAKFAHEPIIPLVLFANRNYAVSTMTSFFIGFVMVGILSYLPLFLQNVYGETPTGSGIQTIPLMLALPVASIISGICISKFGTFRPFTYLGTATIILALYLFSTFPPADQFNSNTMIGYLIIMGLGMGFVMQVLVLIGQNSVTTKQLAIATTTSTFLRQLGFVFGSTVNGVLLTNFASQAATAAVTANVPLDQLQSYIYYHTFIKLFLYNLPIASLCFLLCLLLKRIDIKAVKTKPIIVDSEMQSTETKVVDIKAIEEVNTIPTEVIVHEIPPPLYEEAIKEIPKETVNIIVEEQTKQEDKSNEKKSDDDKTDSEKDE